MHSGVQNRQRIGRRAFLKTAGIAAAAIAPSVFAGSNAAQFLIKNPSRFRLRAGVAKRIVTPPLWVPYLTSSGNGTHAPFGGVHDDLHARALVLDNGKEAIAVLAVDSIGYDNAILGAGRDFTRELRERIAAQTKLKPEAIMLSATHSHSTPETICLTAFRETAGVAQWLENHLNDLVKTVVEAWNCRVPVRGFHGVANVPEVARYRRILLKNGKLNRHGPMPPEGDIARPYPMDEALTTVYFETEAGRPHSVLLNFTAHPVVAMLLPPVSADYPGAAAGCVERELDGAICLFTNGAAGDVNSLHVSTNFADVENLGRKLGNAALSQIALAKANGSIQGNQIQSHSQTLQLAGRECPSLEEFKALSEQASGRVNQRLFRLAQKLAQGPIGAEIQLMRVGPLKWISLPGEAFVETGLALKQASATFVVGYANGWIGYLPVQRAYDEGGYEVDPGPWSRVAPGSAEILELAGKKMLAKIQDRA